MVVTTKKITLGNERYYTELAREDYYTHGGEPPGQWLGEGAKALKLEGLISHCDPRLTALFEGRHPYDGSELRKGATVVRHYQGPDGNIKAHNPVGAYDFTLSPDKSVSVLMAVSPIEVRQSIQAAHFAAVQATAEFLEKHCYTRTGEAGRVHESAKGIFAAFEHSVSRALDPQLHTHLLLLNVGIRKDGRAGALDGDRLLNLQFQCSKVYDAKMRQQLHDRLHLSTIEKSLAKGTSFEISGVPRDLCTEFSKRRQEIEKVLSPHDTAKQVQVKVLASRSPKAKDFNRESLFTLWREVGREFGFDAQQFLEQARNQSRDRCEQETEKKSEHTHGKENSKIGLPEGVSKRKVKKLVNYLLKHQEKIKREVSKILDYYDDTKRYWDEIELRFQRGFQERDEWKIRKKIQQIEREERRIRNNQKFLLLYATGKIRRVDYLRYTEGRGLPTSKLGINIAYATRKISRKQQRYLLEKNGHTQAKEPSTRIGIKVACLTDQISSLKQLTLLKKYGHLQRGAPSPPAFMKKQVAELQREEQRIRDEKERERER
ncbi:MAG: relaxase domain-containing protein [Plectolyngbya sp. WJT66-NPBG17]|jgi:conjugative relaxase-like TrwC/TraI family protein|nr:relaxase domain-containing protein [Plectolyngbya sp. WJT66-NPBG17]